MHLQHIELTVADIDRSRRFFQNALGASVVPDPDGHWFQLVGIDR